MTAALEQIGDEYRSADGVLYSRTDGPALDACVGEVRLSRRAVPRQPRSSSRSCGSRTFASLESLGTRRAAVRWSDGTASEAVTWGAEEIPVCEGDLIGKTRGQLRALYFP
jgi:hypothetical protein